LGQDLADFGQGFFIGQDFAGFGQDFAYAGQDLNDFGWI